jgi:arylsulfatase A-like enzyme
MKRRAFMKSVVAGSVGSVAMVSQEFSKPVGSRPNFLFMIADDLTYRAVHALYHQQVSTPNLDRLVRNGCTFTHCFQQGSWTGAVCIASRTMLTTGLSTFRSEPVGPTPATDYTPLWGQTLGRAGYHTYIAGKWHLDPVLLQRCFKQMGPIGPAMFESGPEAYNRPAPGNTWSPSDTKLKGHWISTATWNNSPNDEIQHSCQVWADCAINHLINDVPKLNDPFFMYIGFNEPHDPRQSPKQFVDMYPAEKIEIPPNYVPEFPFNNGAVRGRDEDLAPYPRTRRDVQVHRSEYYALVSYLDSQVGRILDALEKSGKADNTYVIFTSDHGLAVGQHGLMGKQSMFDHSIRVPYIVNGPGVPTGKKVDELVYQHSTFATTCELAGIPVPSTVEFPSLASLISGPAKPQHDAIFSRYKHFQRTVRTFEHKLIVYPFAKKVQLFDLKKDPWEITNLADRSEMQPARKHLLERLQVFQRELGDQLDLDHPVTPKNIWG